MPKSSRLFRLRISSCASHSKPMSYELNSPREIAFARTRRSRAAMALGSKLTLLTQANMPSSISPSDSVSPFPPLSARAKATNVPVKSSCSRATSAVLPHTPAAPVQAVHPAVCSHWKQNMFSSVISRSSTRGCVFEATTLYCGITYISVVEPTGETNA